MTDLAYIIIITALVAIGACAGTVTAKRSEETEAQANSTINLLFAHLEASREREAAATANLLKLQEQIIKKQQKTIDAQHTRLAQPDAQAAADLRQQYIVPPPPVTSEPDIFNPVFNEYDLDDIDPLSVPKREEEPIEL